MMPQSLRRCYFCTILKENTPSGKIRAKNWSRRVTFVGKHEKSYFLKKKVCIKIMKIFLKNKIKVFLAIQVT